MNFHDINLPKYIAAFAIGSSEFSTSVSTAKSGREVRKSDTQILKRHYILQDCILSMNQFEVFNSFFKARAGMRFGFRLHDPFDHVAKNQIIAIGDGSQKEFQLHKIYDDLISPYVRKITKPTLKSIELIQCTAHIKLDSTNGTIIFSKPPQKEELIRGNFEFDVPVRFAQDNFRYNFRNDGAITLDKIKLIEIFE